MATPALAAIQRAAANHGLDWRSLAAISHYESGLNPGAVGDGGHAFGLFQLNNAGGTITGNPNPRQYLDPYKNAEFAASAMQRLGLNKLNPQQQIIQGVRRFERPAAPDPEVQGALSYFKSALSGAVPTASPHPSRITNTTVDSTQPTPSQGNDPTQTRNALLAYLMTSSANTANGGAGGDPNAGLVSFLSNLPTTASLPSHVNGVPLEPTSQAAATKAAGNPNVQGFVNIAKHFIGTPYSWGGGGVNGPSRGFAQGAKTVGFDCSSFVQYVWNKAAGVNIPRTTYAQFKSGSPVQRNKLQPGDAVYFEPSSQGPQHVGMYIGQGQFIESPHTGASIRISNLNQRSDYVGARRFARGS